jgi:murein DD-endopeptidase MepM/ murein hydrolase activator NlpD
MPRIIGEMMDVKIKYEMEKYAYALEEQRRLANELEKAIDDVLHGGLPVATTPTDPTAKIPVSTAPNAKVEHNISSPYGKRVHPVTKEVSMHHGIDLPAETGTPVYAYDNGVVITVSSNATSGKFIAIRHDGGIVSSYLHLSKQFVSKGDRIRIGQQIGAVGSTGRVTGSHLHFSLKENGRHVNPESHIQNRRLVG